MVYQFFVYEEADIDDLWQQLCTDCANHPRLTEELDTLKIGYDPVDDLAASVKSPGQDDVSVVSPDLPSIVLYISNNYLKRGNEENARMRQDAIVDFTIDIYELLSKQPVAAYVPDTGEEMELGGWYQPITTESIQGEAIDYLPAPQYNDAAWITVFPPAMVDTFGQAVLWDVPTRRLEELDDGTIVTVAEGDPTVGTRSDKVRDALNLPGTEALE